MATRRTASAGEIPPDLDAARMQARDCTACDLYKFATQTVFGEGPPDARVLITVHPSYLLRMPPENRDAEMARFVADLKVARRYAREQGWDL